MQVPVGLPDGVWQLGEGGEEGLDRVITWDVGKGGEDGGRGRGDGVGPMKGRKMVGERGELGVEGRTEAEGVETKVDQGVWGNGQGRGSRVKGRARHMGRG